MKKPRDRWIATIKLSINCLEFRISLAPIFFVLEQQSRAMVSYPPWDESPYKERGACHHVGVRLPRNLSHLSVSYQRTFPLVSPLSTSYLTCTTLSTLHYTRGMHPRVSPPPSPDCHCVYLLACVVGGTNVTTRYDRIILRTFVCPLLSRFIFSIHFFFLSLFFFSRWFL